MNAIRPNLHNVVMIGLIAVLVIVAIKLAASKFGSVPVLGQVLQFGAAA